MKNKPASLLVRFGKTLNGLPPLYEAHWWRGMQSIRRGDPAQLKTSKKADEKLIIPEASPKMKDLAHAKNEFGKQKQTWNSAFNIFISVIEALLHC